jgi:acetoacetyl-CoA reductase
MARVAVVTGGTRGIGAEISRGLYGAGYKVVANFNRNVEGARRFTDETGIPIRAWDVSDYKACEESLKAICDEYGPVDILINNAGITRDVVLHRMPPEAWSEVIETNLTSCFNMCRLVIPAMRDRGFGRIVNISSINGQAGQVGQTNYAAAKAGILGFTKALALESAPKGITVNAICPGYIDTEMVRAVPEKVRDVIRGRIPVGRFGDPREITHAILFLVADDAMFCTGSTITMNGGQYMV